MVPQQNCEDWEVPEDDPGFTRIKFVAPFCPFASECNSDCWKRAKAWSYDSPHAVKNYAARHLMESAKHYKQKDVAIEAVSDLPIDEVDETFQDREEYRRGLEVADRLRRGKQPTPPLGPPPASRRPATDGGGLVCINNKYRTLRTPPSPPF